MPFYKGYRKWTLLTVYINSGYETPILHETGDSRKPTWKRIYLQRRGTTLAHPNLRTPETPTCVHVHIDHVRVTVQLPRGQICAAAGNSPLYFADPLATKVDAQRLVLGSRRLERGALDLAEVRERKEPPDV